MLMDDERKPMRLRGRPKTANDDAHRDQITQVAAELIRVNGYAGTSMNDVATAARVSLSTIYRLFSGKSELFGAVVALHRFSILALPGDYDGLPIEDALMRIFGIEGDDQQSQTRHELLDRLIAATRQFPELEPVLFENGPRQAKSLLAGWLEQQRAQGRMTITDSTVAASMLMDVVFGARPPNDDGAPPKPRFPDRALYLRQCFRMLTDGLKPRTG